MSYRYFKQYALQFCNPVAWDEIAVFIILQHCLGGVFGFDFRYVWTFPTSSRRASTKSIPWKSVCKPYDSCVLGWIKLGVILTVASRRYDLCRLSSIQFNRPVRSLHAERWPSGSQHCNGIAAIRMSHLISKRTVRIHDAESILHWPRS